jgi:hypothetical protein
MKDNDSCENWKCVVMYYSERFCPTGPQRTEFNSQPLCVRFLAKVVAVGNVFHQIHQDFLVNYIYINSILGPLSIFILLSPEWKAAKSTTGLTCRPASQLPRAPNYVGLQDLAGIIADMPLVNSGFHVRKKFLEIYPHLGHAPTKIFASLILSQTFQRAWGAHESRAGPDKDWQPENKTDFFWEQWAKN